MDATENVSTSQVNTWRERKKITPTNAHSQKCVVALAIAGEQVLHPRPRLPRVGRRRIDGVRRALPPRLHQPDSPRGRQAHGSEHARFQKDGEGAEP
eukprot:434185-Prymnesium_polylepis.1